MYSLWRSRPGKQENEYLVQESVCTIMPADHNASSAMRRKSSKETAGAKHLRTPSPTSAYTPSRLAKRSGAHSCTLRHRGERGKGGRKHSGSSGINECAIRSKPGSHIQGRSPIFYDKGYLQVGEGAGGEGSDAVTGRETNIYCATDEDAGGVREPLMVRKDKHSLRKWGGWKTVCTTRRTAETVELRRAMDSEYCPPVGLRYRVGARRREEGKRVTFRWADCVPS